MSTEPNSAESAGGHGRPRPQDTIARDNQVRELLASQGPLTRVGIAEKLSITPSLAYMSLFRLSREGAVRRVIGDTTRSNTWEITPSA